MSNNLIPFLLKRIVYVYLLLMILSSCGGFRSEHRDVVCDVIGKKINLPDSLVCLIQGDMVDLDREVEYTIVSYIDSSECLSCKMKLNV